MMGLFSREGCYKWVDAKGDPLATLDGMVPWENLRKLLGPITFENSRGRPPLDALMMVKCLLLQALYNIADGACEYQINDRLSFKRFLGLAMDEKGPDEKSIWLYRERIKEAKLHEVIFAWFESELQKAGYAAQKGQIIDATFVPTHKPTGKLKKQEEAGIPLTPAQERQRDQDATFTKKGALVSFEWVSFPHMASQGIDKCLQLIRGIRVCGGNGIHQRILCCAKVFSR
jgi:hypothetical protein